MLQECMWVHMYISTHTIQRPPLFCNFLDHSFVALKYQRPTHLRNTFRGILLRRPWATSKLTYIIIINNRNSKLSTFIIIIIFVTIVSMDPCLDAYQQVNHVLRKIRIVWYVGMMSLIWTFHVFTYQVFIVRTRFYIQLIE